MARRPAALVTGAGGFIGHHLVKYLEAEGSWVRGVDVNPPSFEPTAADEFMEIDLRLWDACARVTRGVDEVYHVAAGVGGIGGVSPYRADVARNNTLINLHMLDTARWNGVKRFFFASSGAVYPVRRRREADGPLLKEEDAYPADPEEGFGWEKLYAEKLCQYYAEEGRLGTRVARIHRVYGPLGPYDGGEETAPALVCRKVALAWDGDTIDVPGDPKRSRSFLYVSDCVEGIVRIARSDRSEPLNLCGDRLVTIDGLVDLVAKVAGKNIETRHAPGDERGAPPPNSDNTRLKQVLGWQPRVPLEQGLEETYRWIEGQLRKAGRVSPVRVPRPREGKGAP